MFDPGIKKQKLKLPVEVELQDGSYLLGHAFVGPQQRLSDLLNDDRVFLPLETPDGVIINIRKSVMARVTECNQKGDPRAQHDPYTVLGVSPSVDEEELRAAYLALVRESHPDRFANVGLPGEILEAVKNRMARINDAYHRVLKARAHNRGAAL